MLDPLRLAAALVLILAVACSGNNDNNGSGAGIEVGAILPLNGALASYGEASQAALDEAVEAINQRVGARLTLVVENSNSEAATALEKLQGLHARGIRVVVGPYSSSEVHAVRDFANANGMVLLSPLSTAGDLAIPGDNIFRFTPDDNQNGVALAGLAWSDGVRTLISVSRDDPGNRGLQAGTKTSFEALGGTIVEGVVYRTDEPDFPGVVTRLEQAIAALSTPPGEMAIYLTAFGEVTSLFQAASESSILRSLRWYGSDSVALSADLVQDATAARFAIEVDYPNPLLGLRAEDESRWKPVSDKLEERLGRQADTFALAAYDALVVAYEAIAAAGGTQNADRLKSEIVNVAGRTTGLTGPLRLNDAGDRDLASYDFWSVCQRSDGFAWTRSATFFGQAARIQSPSC